MPQNRADMINLLNEAGEHGMTLITKNVREKRLQQKYRHGLLWLPYRKLKTAIEPLSSSSSLSQKDFSMEKNVGEMKKKLEDMVIGVQILPLSRGGVAPHQNKILLSRKGKKGRGKQENSFALLKEAMMQMVRNSCAARLLFVQEDDLPPDGFFMERLEELLKQTSFPAWRLDFSFSQSVFQSGGENYWFHLAALRDGGARIFMRDFLAAPSSLVILEEAYRASLLDGIQCRIGYFLSQEEKENIWGVQERIFRQHILTAVRSLGLIIQINDVSRAQEQEIAQFFQNLDVAASQREEEQEQVRNTHCEIIAPSTEALTSLRDDLQKDVLVSPISYKNMMDGELA